MVNLESLTLQPQNALLCCYYHFLFVNLEIRY